MQPVRIALVGIGGYGESYLSELLPVGQDERVQLIAGIDPQPERCLRLEELRESQVPIFPSLEEFFRHDQADLVIIAAPIHLHAPLTCLAVEHGANVLCEKPLAGSLADAQRMLAAERLAGKFVAVGYQWSFSDTVLALKRDIIGGRFGRPLHLKTAVLWPRGRSYYQRSPWAGRIHLGNDAWVLDSPLHNATAHYLHNMLFLLGDTLQTSARPIRQQVELYRANPIENFDTAALRIFTPGEVDLLFLTAHPVNLYRGPLIQYEFEQAIIEYPCDTGSFQAYLHQGQTIDYGSPDVSNANKLWQSVAAIQEGSPLVCGLQTALPELICAAGAQAATIHSFPATLIRSNETEFDQLTYVDGLAETLLDSYASGRLPHELPQATWSSPAELIDLC
jgi:predicted dehydrogenase